MKKPPSVVEVKKANPIKVKIPLGKLALQPTVELLHSPAVIDEEPLSVTKIPTAPKVVKPVRTKVSFNKLVPQSIYKPLESLVATNQRSHNIVKPPIRSTLLKRVGPPIKATNNSKTELSQIPREGRPRPVVRSNVKIRPIQLPQRQVDIIKKLDDSHATL